jgi:hypothetical protein
MQPENQVVSPGFASSQAPSNVAQRERIQNRPL